MPQRPELDPELLRLLRCPRCLSLLEAAAEGLTCEAGHRYPVVEGVPVFIIPEADQTIGLAAASYRAAVSGAGAPFYVETLGVPEELRREILGLSDKAGSADIDPAVNYLVGATCGRGYAGRIGRLNAYPIPRFPDPGCPRGLLLDLGCSWGRWSVAASRAGWRAIGLDPSLGAVLAARRNFSDQTAAMFVCGDARFLPFASGSFKCVFSYSVIQHLSHEHAETALGEIGRVLEPNGRAMIQMAHSGGLRGAYIRRRQDYAAAGVFRVRYWPLARLRQVFGERIGRSTLRAEAFGGLGLLPEDWAFISGRARMLVILSTLCKHLARVVKPLIRLADSVYVVSVKP